jgi:hypothetical protein
MKNLVKRQRALYYLAALVATFLSVMLPTLLSTIIAHAAHVAESPRETHHVKVMALVSVMQAFGAVFLLSGSVGGAKIRTAFAFFWFWLWTTISICFYLMIFVALFSWGRIPSIYLVGAYTTDLSAIWASLGFLDKLLFCGGLVVVPVVSFSLVYVMFNIISRTLIEEVSGTKYQKKRDLRVVGGFAMLAAAPVFLFVHAVAYDPFWPQDYLRLFMSEPDNVATSDMLLPVLTRIGDEGRRARDTTARQSYPIVALNSRPNVILIVVDALRPDHMSTYGYSRPTTPKLTELVEKQRVALQRDARSACAESSCGILSLLSGRHGHEILPQSFDLLSVLGLHGYHRSLLLSGDHTNFYNLRGAYGHVDNYWDGSMSGGYVNDDNRLLDHLRDMPDADAATPYFIYLHLMSAHGLAQRDMNYVKWTPVASPYGVASIAGRALRDGYVNGYDNGVLQADGTIASIIAELKRKKYLLDDSALVITADHGESLGEHNVMTHAAGVHESVLRIPLLWSGPIARAVNLSRSATHADVAPTILHHIGLPLPTSWTGVPLQQEIVASEESLSLHIQPPKAALIGYIGGIARYKYVRDYQTNTRRFYDLQRDPTEKQPLSQIDTKHLIGRDPDKLMDAQRLDRLVRSH